MSFDPQVNNKPNKINVFPFFEPTAIAPPGQPISIPYEATLNIIEAGVKKEALKSQKLIVNDSFVKPYLPPVSDFDASSPYGIDQSMPYSQLGEKVISWIDFIKNDTFPAETLLTIAECIITVNQRPRITKQYTIGADGSVKTYIGQDDYEITIEGYIFNNSGDGTAAAYDGVYPRKRMDTFQEIINGQGSTLGIRVYSPYLDLYDIDFLVVSICEFPQEEGGYGQQKFNLVCQSDTYADSDKIYSPYNV